MTLPRPPADIDAPATARPAADDVAAALGRIPSGLFVVSWREDGLDRTMLASWVMQAGFVPPEISIAVAAGRDLLAALDRGADVTVNILAESQRSLLSRFGRPAAAGDDPCAGLEVARSPAGNAVLAGASGWLEGRMRTRTSGGDHTIVVLTVRAAGPGPNDAPLVHTRRNGLRY